MSGRGCVREERGSVREGSCQRGVLSERGCVREGFCQRGVVSERGCVREEEEGHSM